MKDRPISRINLADPGELIASIPYLIGFYPTDSLLAILLTDLERSQVSGIARTELPVGEPHEDYGNQLLLLAQRLRATAVVLVIISDTGTAVRPEPPHRQLVELIDRVLAADGVELGHCLWACSTATGSEYACYDTPICRGTVPASDNLAISKAAADRVIFANLDEARASLAPDDPQDLDSRASIIASRMGPFAATSFRAPASARQRLTLIQTTFEQVGAGSWEPDDASYADLALALLDQRIIDVSLALSLDEGASVAKQLWHRLAQALPAGFRAIPAFLLAATAFAIGDGTTANLALEAALEADPELESARLLQDAIAFGIRPNHFADMMAAAGRSAEQAITEASEQ